MKFTSFRASSPILSLLLAAVCGGLSSCSSSPQEQLQGRWYNEALSMRFRPDGSLIYNSNETGLTTGRYFFNGDLRPASADEPVPNLTLDLVRGSRVVRSQLEVQFVGSERLRLRTVPEPGRGRSAGNEPGILVLKRAAQDGHAELAASR
jgi:hypothetical protein